MDLTRLQELKQKLLHDKELLPIWQFFLDHLGENPAFIALGEQAQHPFLEAAIVQVAQQMFPRGGAISGLLLSKLEEQQFLHGGFFIGARPGGVLYFEDVGIGLVAAADLPPSNEAKCARFSGHPIPGPGEPSRN